MKTVFISAQQPKTPTRLGFRPKLRYQKLGAGSIPLFNSLIKPNQVISAYPEDIPARYKDILVCIDSTEMQEWAKKESEKALEKEFLYELVEKTHGWWEVVNRETKKAINEKSLRKADAETLRDSLNT